MLGCVWWCCGRVEVMVVVDTSGGRFGDFLGVVVFIVLCGAIQCSGCGGRRQ